MNFSRMTCDARPGRIGPLATLPVFLVLDGKRAVIAGGSAAAAWKAELLSAAGARVDVFAGEISAELRAVAADPPGGTIAVHERAWAADDLNGAAVAVGAFEEDAGAAAFAQAARTAGVPVNVIDRPAFCDFTFGAIVNRSPLVIGISTDGTAPVFAQAIRAKLEALLPRRFAAWAAAAQSWRAAVKASGLSYAARRKFRQRFTAHAMRRTDGGPSQADFDGLLAEAKGQGGRGRIRIGDGGRGRPARCGFAYATRRARAAIGRRHSVRRTRIARRAGFRPPRSAQTFGQPQRLPPLRPTGRRRCADDQLAEKGKHVVRLTGSDPSGSLHGKAAEETAANSAAAPAASAVRSGAAA